MKPFPLPDVHFVSQDQTGTMSNNMPAKPYSAIQTVQLQTATCINNIDRNVLIPCFIPKDDHENFTRHQFSCCFMDRSIDLLRILTETDNLLANPMKHGPPLCCLQGRM